jgi:hypothetical protein
MDKGFRLYNLKKGIRLEKSQTLLPWKTDLKDLQRYGNPEVKKQAGREIVVWKNEEIMNGLHVNLNVIYESAIFNREKKLKNVSAYLSETDFEQLKQQLKYQLGTGGKYKQINDMEFRYTWKTDHCTIILSHLCSFGTYWKIDIRQGFTVTGMFNRILRARFKWSLRHILSRYFNMFFFAPDLANAR